ncbi:epidermal growth factor-like protein 7 isoform X1 [Brienomyrus brachyistius]|uniref:epidermal growth factor-like protein 7 isoform X1 n=1 Tax=Brienomyrus brachyistius TaxID=42636 RepID=UPI0020B45EA2|nr:epidermal growth factor-like protein 7 isoform X1 [Brienomyrus brachyistius]XP_048874867.1 epidermal growth factor-like protein 7 isoform X1 [Brienomyrus brachyistius]XP_048874868.1 epidermal growth factor-like protein 7 isoform X1 [Brienomyrus brachyistius]
MYPVFLLLSSLLFVHTSCTSHIFRNHGRRVCLRDAPQHSPVLHTESFVQTVHKPYLTLCHDHRLCSTYKTMYRVSYRQVSLTVPVSYSYPECCPGWRRFYSHNCNQAVCFQPCVNGGTCIRPDHCSCGVGWTGRRCQTDLDECSGPHPCAQQCFNTPGSYQCGCLDGYQLARDGRSCQAIPLPVTTAVPTATPESGKARADDAVTEEVQSLKNRVEVLEQKLQLALAPFDSLFSRSLGEDVAEKTSFLTHSFQQLDRIDSLSEQVGFLEERLGSCECSSPHRG